MAANEEHHVLKAPVFDDNPRVAIVVAPYYRDIADMLITGATRAVEAAGGRAEVIEVPGALEVPPAIRIAARGGDFDAFVGLGCVIRGETTHYDTVCNDSSRGLMELGLYGLAIGNGILTVENREQAVARAEPDGQNKGGGAAEAALHLLALQRRFLNRTKGIGFRPQDGAVRIAGTDTA